MKYDEALNFVFETGYLHTDYVNTQAIIDALTLSDIAEDIELRDMGDGTFMLIILIPVIEPMGYAEIKLKTMYDAQLGYNVSRWYDDDFIPE
jgi:hypothetical protein